MATSYSKIKEETDSNTFVLLMRYSPLVVNNRTAKDIFDTFVYFMKTADPSRKSGDVLDELIHFQKTLVLDFEKHFFSNFTLFFNAS